MSGLWSQTLRRWLLCLPMSQKQRALRPTRAAVVIRVAPRGGDAYTNRGDDVEPVLGLMSDLSLAPSVGDGRAGRERGKRPRARARLVRICSSKLDLPISIEHVHELSQVAGHGQNALAAVMTTVRRDSASAT